ncbi:YjbH domain-containing protein [Radicibacter daui]|uniref:YjbH domain-containing protein n=1 Tax=Radicibacter daui TaxID=3064829 RepID=UPI00404702AC
MLAGASPPFPALARALSSSLLPDAGFPPEGEAGLATFATAHQAGLRLDYALTPRLALATSLLRPDDAPISGTLDGKLRLVDPRGTAPGLIAGFSNFASAATTPGDEPDAFLLTDWQVGPFSLSGGTIYRLAKPFPALNPVLGARLTLIPGDLELAASAGFVQGEPLYGFGLNARLSDSYNLSLQTLSPQRPGFMLLLRRPLSLPPLHRPLPVWRRPPALNTPPGQAEELAEDQGLDPAGADYSRSQQPVWWLSDPAPADARRRGRALRTLGAASDGKTAAATLSVAPATRGLAGPVFEVPRSAMSRADGGTGSAEEVIARALTGFPGAPPSARWTMDWQAALNLQAGYSRRQIGGTVPGAARQVAAGLTVDADLAAGFGLVAEPRVTLANEPLATPPPAGNDAASIVRQALFSTNQSPHHVDRLFLSWQQAVNAKSQPTTPPLWLAAEAGALDPAFTGLAASFLTPSRQGLSGWGAGGAFVLPRGEGVERQGLWTANATYSFALPVQGLDLTLEAGRYLAGDLGATARLERRWSDGTRLGISAAVSTLSGSGEGSGGDGRFWLSLTLPVGMPAAHPHLAVRLTTGDPWDERTRRPQTEEDLADRLHQLGPAPLVSDWQYLLD